LLDSESATGAYRFTIRPGPETSIDVDMTLFPRTDLHVVGIAPLTSMFLFDETNRGKLDDYRPEVHDSDGLQVTTKSGETLWRPLANPANLQVSAFTTEPPRDSVGARNERQHRRVFSTGGDADAIASRAFRIPHGLALRAEAAEGPR
jgi:glucan biosynthesis protein